LITTANGRERDGWPPARRVGLEQEFFLVDEDGNVCRKADLFLLWCRSEAEDAGLDQGCFKEEWPRAWSR
jgi:hypothetical protein